VADGNGAGSDPTSELVRGILLSVAKFEKAMIAARIKAALAVKQGRGERISRYLPYGSQLGQDGRSLEPHPQEQAVLARARQLRAEGKTLAQVSAELSQEGKVNRQGKPFGLSTLHGMVTL
jgi:DNA invertase Pin-like site-specific DNA recombinase